MNQITLGHSRPLSFLGLTVVKEKPLRLDPQRNLLLTGHRGYGVLQTLLRFEVLFKSLYPHAFITRLLCEQANADQSITKAMESILEKQAQTKKPGLVIVKDLDLIEDENQLKAIAQAINQGRSLGLSMVVAVRSLGNLPAEISSYLKANSRWLKFHGDSGDTQELTPGQVLDTQSKRIFWIDV